VRGLRAGGGLRREGTRRLIRWRADGTLVLPRREEILDPGCLRRGRAQLVHPSLQPRTRGEKLLALAALCRLLERAALAWAQAEPQAERRRRRRPWRRRAWCRSGSLRLARPCCWDA